MGWGGDGVMEGGRRVGGCEVGRRQCPSPPSPTTPSPLFSPPGLLESSFDTIIFGLTVLPLIGWGKCARATHARRLAPLGSRLDLTPPPRPSPRPTLLGRLLPTFGGRVLTEADGLRLEGDELVMELQRTKVVPPPRGRP